MDNRKAYLCTVAGDGVVVIACSLHGALDILKAKVTDPDDPSVTYFDLLESISDISDEVLS